MKRMTRRLLAMLLAALMMVSALPVYAAGEGTTVLYGESDVFVCQDGTITWIDFVDGMTYGFSAYTDDSLFFCLSETSSGIVQEYTFLQVPQLTTDADLNSPEVRNSILSYCLENLPSHPENTMIANTQSISSYATTSDPNNTYSVLEDKMRQLYGSSYSNRVLKTDTTTYPGNTIVVKGMLDTVISLNTTYGYQGKQKIASFLASLQGPIGELLMKGNNSRQMITAICNMYNLPSDEFVSSGTLVFYDCSAYFNHYTSVNGKAGPYSQATRADYRLGLSDHGRSVAIQLVLLDTIYSPNQSYYQDTSYSGLIRDGYWSYTH